MADLSVCIAALSDPCEYKMSCFRQHDGFWHVGMVIARNLRRHFNPCHEHGFAVEHGLKQPRETGGELLALAIDGQDDIGVPVIACTKGLDVVPWGVLRRHDGQIRAGRLNQISDALASVNDSTVGIDVTIDEEHMALRHEFIALATIAKKGDNA